MSDQVTAPLAVLTADLRAPQSPEGAAAGQAVYSLFAIWEVTAVQMAHISQLSKQHGLAAMLATLPEDKATAARAAINFLLAAWPVMSDKPVPVIYEQPEP